MEVENRTCSVPRLLELDKAASPETVNDGNSIDKEEA